MALPQGVGGATPEGYSRHTWRSGVAYREGHFILDEDDNVCVCMSSHTSGGWALDSTQIDPQLWRLAQGQTAWESVTPSSPWSALVGSTLQLAIATLSGRRRVLMRGVLNASAWATSELPIATIPSKYRPARTVRMTVTGKRSVLGTLLSGIVTVTSSGVMAAWTGVTGVAVDEMSLDGLGWDLE